MLKIGTDCSGIEAPIEALKKICKNHQLEYKHVFSSEIDEYAIKYIQANHSPEILYGDMQKRNVNKLPKLDIYVAGFPCQPFSRANKFKTEVDPRLNLFENCVDVIKYSKPKMFILENVKTLTTLDNGSYFNKILKQLEDIGRYTIYWKILNTKDYGIPQCRERLFIVGINKKSSKNTFEFPEKIKMKKLTDFIDKTDTSKYPIKDANKELLQNIPKNSVFIDIGFRKAKFPNSDKWAPCITAQANMWCVPMKRKASVKEYLMLQGFPTSVNQPISDHQMKKKIGNSMTVDVIEQLLLGGLYALNMI
jgi:DNA (cytosine-5)-methyltransferase 1